MKSNRVLLLCCLIFAALLAACNQGEVSPTELANPAIQTAVAETPAAGATAQAVVPAGEATQTAATAEVVATEVSIGISPTVATAQTAAATAAGASVSPLASPTAGPSLTDPVPAGLLAPDNQFGPQWKNISGEIGWATGKAVAMPMAWQRFENGEMVWLSQPITGTKTISNPTVLVLYGNDDWLARRDTWQEGQPESDPKLAPPAGMLQPIRGFGKIWREVPNLKDDLGWALAKEVGADGIVQPFEHGLMLTVNGLTYALTERTGQRTWHGY